MKIGQKVMVSFAGVMAATLAVGLTGWIELSAVNRSYSEMIDDRVEKIMLIQELKAITANESKDVRGYLLTGSPAHRERYEENRVLFTDTMDRLSATLSQETSIRLAGELSRQEAEYAVLTDELIQYRNAGDLATLNTYIEERNVPLADAMGETAEELRQFQHGLLVQSQSDTKNLVGQIKLVLQGTILLALIMVIAFAAWITRIVSRPVKRVAAAAKQIADGDLTGEDLNIRQKDELGEMAQAFNEMKRSLHMLLRAVSGNADHLTRSSSELAVGAGQAAVGSDAIAGAVQDISASSLIQTERMNENRLALQESSESLKRLAESASATADSSEQAFNHAEAGRLALEESMAKIKELQTNMDESASIVFELGEKSKAIEGISLFIKEIAGQTNLLALNASIEAARAGEHGAGFAVVAGEVKKLSEQSAEASVQITDYIHGILGMLDQAVHSMKTGAATAENGTVSMLRTGEAFDEMHGSAQRVAERAQEVAATTEELSAVTEQLLASKLELVALTETISGQSQNVAAVTEEQLAAMQQISASADMLREMAEHLNEELGRFRLADEDLTGRSAAAERVQEAAEGASPASLGVAS